MKFHIVTVLNRDLPLYTRGLKDLKNLGPHFFSHDFTVNIFSTTSRKLNSLVDFKVTPSGVTTFDQCMQIIRRNLSIPNGEYILLLDNDCFIYEPWTTYQSLLETYYYNIHFKTHAKDRPYLSYFVNQTDYLCPQDKDTGFYSPEQKFLPSNDIYRFVPSPHYENAFCIIPGWTWNRLKESDFSNTRQLWKAIADQTTMKAFYVEHKLTYSHLGPGFFHIGNLMNYIHRIEAGDYSTLNSGELAASRVGCLMKNESVIGEAVYGDLRPAMEACGGRENCIRAWNELVNHVPQLGIGV